MAWIVVPALEELRVQLNAIAPDRDKTSDGSIGDTSHAAGRSSHNPDRTGNPEYRDGDGVDEVRARDFDADLRTPGLTMFDVVQHLVRGCREGRFWWIRYIIFEGQIYHKNVGNYAARRYTGGNSHHHHAHVNTDFTQKADTVRGVDYRFEEINDMPLSSADKDWIGKRIDSAVAAAVEQVANYPINVTPGEKTANLQPWSRVDAWASSERKVVRSELAAVGRRLIEVEKVVTQLAAPKPTVR